LPAHRVTPHRPGMGGDKLENSEHIGIPLAFDSGEQSSGGITKP
jgi:hypothetical protein